MDKPAINPMLRLFKRRIKPNPFNSEARIWLDGRTELVVNLHEYGAISYFIEGDEGDEVEIPRWAALALARAAVDRAGK